MLRRADLVARRGTFVSLRFEEQCTLNRKKGLKEKNTFSLHASSLNMPSKSARPSPLLHGRHFHSDDARPARGLGIITASYPTFRHARPNGGAYLQLVICLVLLWVTWSKFSIELHHGHTSWHLFPTGNPGSCEMLCAMSGLDSPFNSSPKWPMSASRGRSDCRFGRETDTSAARHRILLLFHSNSYSVKMQSTSKVS